MQQALRNGLIERNPVKLAELPRQEERKERQAMTREQQALFMEYAKESYLYNLFAVMLRTGMRSGEIWGLKYTDIDKKKNVLHVQRTLKYIEGKGYLEDTPKTRTSKRDIPMTVDILELLEAQKRYWDLYSHVLPDTKANEMMKIVNAF
ncbi:MAG: site-specific integrase [Muricoprocola sp.]